MLKCIEGEYYIQAPHPPYSIAQLEQLGAEISCILQDLDIHLPESEARAAATRYIRGGDQLYPRDTEYGGRYYASIQINNQKYLVREGRRQEYLVYKLISLDFTPNRVVNMENYNAPRLG